MTVGFKGFCATAVGVAITGVLLHLQPLAGADWPRWRGPYGTGVSTDALPIQAWSAGGPPVVWTNAVGTGFSSLAVSQGRVYTLGNTTNVDTVFCLAADTGTVRWRYSYASELDPNLYEGGPSTTPTVESNRVYTLGKWGDLFCFEADTGTILWRTNLVRDLGIAPPDWGFAGSPVVEGNQLLLNAGGSGLSLDKLNGRLQWLSNTNRAGYSTPVVYDQDGVRAMLLFGRRAVQAAALADGHLLWSHFWTTANDMNIADPIVFAGGFFVSSYRRSATLLDVVGTSTAAVWQNSNLSVHLSPGLQLGNYLYAFHGEADVAGQGELRCLDLTTGNLKWAAPLVVGSVISADNKLLALSGTGELVLAEVRSDIYRELARAQVLEGKCWTPPAYADGRLYARNAAGRVVALAIAVPPTPPSLEISLADTNLLRLRWPASAEGYQLERSGELASTTNWAAVTGNPVVEGDHRVQETEMIGPRGFYRLQKP
jgi:outer membrane protein assembly factor BamB